VKWGAGLTYAGYKQGDANDTELTLRAGVQIMDFEPFVWYKLIGALKVPAPQDASWKSMGLGLRYKMGEWIPFLGVREDKVTAAGTDIQKIDVMGLGIGRNARLAEGIRMNYALSIFHVTPAGYDQTVVPLNMGVEADALSWMTVRAGMAFNIIDRKNDVTQADAAAGRLGVLMHAGKADFEFAVGNNAAGVEGTGYDCQTFALDRSFFTAANIAYHW
jgi:hypothetical protein